MFRTILRLIHNLLPMSKEEKLSASLKENHNIVDFLDDYFESENPPAYAVLLSGEWGCGKTFLMKKIMKRYTKKRNNKKSAKDKPEDLFIYISLYGIKDQAAIDSLIFFKNLHPILSSNIGVAGGSIAKEIMRYGLNHISPSSDTDILDNIGESIKKLWPIGNNKIFIFDDLERCKIDPQDLLGYINTFVEHDARRVVLLSNEKLLFSKEEDLRKYKEKVIGRTYEVSPCFDEAFELFVESVKNKQKNRNARTILSDHQETIKDVYNFIDNNNLRSLQQAIIDFPHFIKQFPNELMVLLKKMEISRRWYGNYESRYYLDHVVQMYFYLSLKDKEGGIGIKNWTDEVCFFYEGMKDADKFTKEELKEQRKENMIRAGYIRSDGVLGMSWYDAVINNTDVSDILLDAYKKMKEFIDKHSRRSIVWTLIAREIINMKPSEFKKSFKLLRNEINYNKLNDWEELLHAIGLMLHYSKLGIIPDAEKEIINMCRNKVTDYASEKNFEPLDEFDLHTGGAGGWAIYEFQLLKDNGIIDLILEKQKLKKEQNIKTEFLELIKNIAREDKLLELCEHLIVYNYNVPTGKFSKYPVLSYIEGKDRESFFKAVMSHKVMNILKLISSLDNRYNLSVSNAGIESYLIPEKSFINSFNEYAKQKWEEEPRTNNPNIEKYQHVMEWLKNIIAEFNKVENKKPTAPPPPPNK